jgi:hypothetical protein
MTKSSTRDSLGHKLTVAVVFRFPHDYYGLSGGGSRLKFAGADPRCNQAQPNPSLLLEYPVFSDGRVYDKNANRGGNGTPTPARVVYLKEGSILCGVMTHVIESANGNGSGDFRVCDYY